MNKIVDWILHYKIKAGLIIAGLFIIPLLVIHFLYKWQTPLFLLQSSWSSGELITYIAGFEAFLGTVVLGIASVYLNENLLNHERNRSAYERKPEIEVSSSTASIYTQYELTQVEYPIYFHKFIPSRGRTVAKLNRKFCLYSLYLTPKKNSDLRITSTDIILRYLKPEESYETIEFERVPDQFEYFNSHIQNDKYYIYFKLDKRIVLRNRNFIGELSMNLMNAFDDYYTLRITFTLNFTLLEDDIQNTSIKIIDYEILPNNLVC